MPRTKVTHIEESQPVQDTADVVAYRVGQLENVVKEGFKEHNDKLDKIVANFATASALEEVDKRVTSLESDRKWLVRLVVGAVVFAMLSLIGVGFKTFSDNHSTPTTTTSTKSETK